VEVLLRPWNIEGQSVRPAHRMVAHTGFLTTARRVQDTFKVGPLDDQVDPDDPEAADSSDEPEPA